MARGKNKLINNNNCFQKNNTNISYTNDLINKENVNNNEYNFNSYLAGLFEGDGHIWIPKNQDMKKHNPRFCITFNKKDLPLAKKILEKIGFGFIRIKTKENAVVLTVSSIKGLKIILNWINKFLRTPKIYQVNKLINWLNVYHKTDFSILSKNNTLLNLDSWLAGFIDADGGFLISFIKNKLNNKVTVKFTMTIEQRMIAGESYESIMKLISDFFGINLRIRYQKSTLRSYYRIVVTSKKSILILINYLDKYNLFSSKYLNYKDWKLGTTIKFNNKILSDKNKNDILYLKMNMNNKRTYYNWEHMKNFFN